MRRIVSMVITMLFLVGSFAATGCAPAATKELKACDVKLRGVYPVFSGTESIAYLVTFNISNPNDFQVTLDSLDYVISAEKKILAGTKMSDPVYIPAGKTVKLTTFFVTDFAGLMLPKMMDEGLSPGAATVATLPMWKWLGGKIPNPALKEAWDKVQAKSLTFEASIEEAISGGGTTLIKTYNLSIQ